MLLQGNNVLLNEPTTALAVVVAARLMRQACKETGLEECRACHRWQGLHLSLFAEGHWFVRQVSKLFLGVVSDRHIRGKPIICGNAWQENLVSVWAIKHATGGT